MYRHNYHRGRDGQFCKVQDVILRCIVELMRSRLPSIKY